MHLYTINYRFTTIELTINYSCKPLTTIVLGKYTKKLHFIDNWGFFLLFKCFKNALEELVKHSIIGHINNCIKFINIALRLQLRLHLRLQKRIKTYI